VIDNNAKSNKLEDQVFWYKAAPHPDFRLCDASLWSLPAAADRGDDGDGDFDPSAGGRGRRWTLNITRS
jgi:hypothetical protein